MKLNWIDQDIHLELSDSLETDRDYLQNIFEKYLNRCREALLKLQESPMPWIYVIIDEEKIRLRLYLTSEGKVNVAIEKSKEQQFEEKFKELLGEVYNEIVEENYHHKELEKKLKKDGKFDQEIDIIDRIIQEW